MKRQITYLIFIVVSLIFMPNAWASTIVSGDQYGTWDLAGSPYLVESDVSVPYGQVLNIEPGVTILLYDNVSINVYGQIIAVGTQDQRIIFKAVNGSLTWNRIYISNLTNPYTQPPTSRFGYCDFSNAQYALYAHVEGDIDNVETIMQIDIFNCTFASSVVTAISGEAEGRQRHQPGTPRRLHARINPIIERCLFEGTNIGVDINTHGGCTTWCFGGYSNTVIRNSIFSNISESALTIRYYSNYSSGTVKLINNTIVDSNIGVENVATYVTEIRNNVFYNNTTAIQAVSSTTVQYNSFFNNTEDCIGCSVSFGDPVWTNANGDPSDISSNIFMDPLFIDPSTDYHLTDLSPLIESGSEVDAPGIDMDNNSRPQDGNGNTTALYDMGAYEYAGPPYCVEGDIDNDTICDDSDNCPLFCNSDQLDADNDEQGDVCDLEEPGCGEGCGQSACEESCGLTAKIEELLTHYYWNILDRAPELGGFIYWRDEIMSIVSSGGDIKDGYISFAQFFFNSPEYLGRDKDDEEYVINLYNTFFDREPEPAGLGYWVDQLEQGMSRNDVLDYFVFSTEFYDFMEELFFGTS